MLMWLPTAGLADSFDPNTGYTDAFSDGGLLPWLVQDGDYASRFISPGEYEQLFGSRMISPVLPLAVDSMATQSLRIEAVVDQLYIGDAPVLFFHFNSYADFSSPVVAPAQLSLSHQSDPWSDELRYTVAIDLALVPPPPPNCRCDGVVVQLTASDDSYSSNEVHSFELKEIAFDWSKPRWTPELSWPLGRTNSLLPDGWESQSVGGSWRPDSGVLAAEASEGAEVVRLEATTPAFRFTDIASAYFSLQFEMKVDYGYNALTDRVEIDLLAADGSLIASLTTKWLDDIIRDIGTQASGVIDTYILQDAFGGEAPPNHVDGVTTYRIRTRIWDEDDDKFNEGFRGRLIGIGDFDLSHALLADSGDYNRDGRIDAADYTLWRDATVAGGLAADGDGDGVVDSDDDLAWRDSYGVGVAAGAIVPEPSACIHAATLAVAAAMLVRPRKRLRSV